MFTININNTKYSFDFQHTSNHDETWTTLNFPKVNGVTFIAVTSCDVSKEIKPGSNIYDEKIIAENAWCSELDKFNKSIGRKIALTRCLNKLNLNKEQRKKVWEKYFSMVKY